MHTILRKICIIPVQYKCRSGNVVSGNIVGHIDDGCLGVYAQYYPFHTCGVAIIRTEIRAECYDRHAIPRLTFIGYVLEVSSEVNDKQQYSR